MRKEESEVISLLRVAQGRGSLAARLQPISIGRNPPPTKPEARPGDMSTSSNSSFLSHTGVDRSNEEVGQAEIRVSACSSTCRSGGTRRRHRCPTRLLKPIFLRARLPKGLLGRHCGRSILNPEGKCLEQEFVSSWSPVALVAPGWAVCENYQIEDS